MAKPGRPTKLTPKVCKAIVGYLRRGVFIETAAALAKVHRVSVFGWIARGRKEAERIAEGKDPEPGEAIFLDFFYAVEEAQAVPELAMTEVLVAAAEGRTDGNYKAAAWYLEHARPSRWQPGRQQQETEVPDSIAEFNSILEKARAERHG